MKFMDGFDWSCVLNIKKHRGIVCKNNKFPKSPRVTNVSVQAHELRVRISKYRGRVPNPERDYQLYLIGSYFIDRGGRYCFDYLHDVKQAIHKVYQGYVISSEELRQKYLNSQYSVYWMRLYPGNTNRRDLSHDFLGSAGQYCIHKANKLNEEEFYEIIQKREQARRIIPSLVSMRITSG
jgi:hypothetical protein